MRHFWLYWGRYEDQSLALLFVDHDEPFDSPVAAMEAFREVLAEDWKASQERHARYCSHCGTPLDPPTPEREMVATINLFERLFHGTIDSCARLIERFEDHGWRIDPPGMPSAPVVRISGIDQWLDGEGDLIAEVPSVYGDQEGR